MEGCEEGVVRKLLRSQLGTFKSNNKELCLTEAVLVIFKTVNFTSLISLHPRCQSFIRHILISELLKCEKIDFRSNVIWQISGFLAFFSKLTYWTTWGLWTHVSTLVSVKYWLLHLVSFPFLASLSLSHPPFLPFSVINSTHAHLASPKSKAPS